MIRKSILIASVFSLAFVGPARAAVFPDQLLGYYSFDADTADDTSSALGGSASTNNGTWTGTAVYKDGFFGRACEVGDGAGSNFITLDGAEYDFGASGSFTVVYWVNMKNAVSGDPVLVAGGGKNWSTSGGTRGWVSALLNGDDVKANVGDGGHRGDTGPIDLDHDAYWNDGQEHWTFVAIVVDRDAQTLTNYVADDNVSATSTAWASGVVGQDFGEDASEPTVDSDIANVGDLTAGDTTIVVGQDGDGGGYSLPASGIDDLSVWGRALTRAELWEIYAEGRLNGQALGDIVVSDKTCPSDLTCTTSTDPQAQVVLSWSPASGLDATGIEVLRDGSLLATLPLDAATYTDTPTLPADPGYAIYEYTVRVVGNDSELCGPLSCTAVFYTGALADDSVLHLPLDSDGSDVSGLGNNGTVGGTPDFSQAGQIGNAALFDDTALPEQHVSVPPAASLLFGESTDFTIAAWVNNDNIGFFALSTILATKDISAANAAGWGIAGNDMGGWRWNIGDGANSASYSSPDGVLDDGAWHHILVAHRRDGEAVLYFDGAEVARRNISQIGSVDSGLPVTVANDPDLVTAFPGFIDDVLVWRRALAPAEVADLFDLGATSHQTISHDSPPHICPAHLTAQLTSASPFTVELNWLPGQNLDSTGVEILRNGETIATIAADASTYTDQPAPPPDATTTYIYSIRMTGGSDSADCPQLDAEPVVIFSGPVSTGLVLYLPMDGNVDDLSGNNAVTSVNGAPTFTAGQVGQSISLDNPSPLNGATPQYVNAGSAPILNFGTDTDFSVQFWVRTTSDFPGSTENHNDPAILSNKNWNNGANQGWYIGGGGNGGAGAIQWNIGDGAGPAGRMDYDGPGGQINDGDWHHVVWVLDRDTSTTTYIDGVPVNTQGPTDAFNLDTPEGFETRIGTDGEAGATWPAYFPGDLDEVAIWNRALFPYEVENLHDMGLAGTPILVPGGTISITAISTNLAANQVTLAWTSNLSGPFDIYASTDLEDFGTKVAEDATSPQTITLPPSLADEPKLFFRVAAP